MNLRGMRWKIFLYTRRNCSPLPPRPNQLAKPMLPKAFQPNLSGGMGVGARRHSPAIVSSDQPLENYSYALVPKAVC